MKNEPVSSYARRLAETSARALGKAGVHQYQLKLAGQLICLRFAGPALEEAILPGLGHLLTDESNPPSLTVILWDTASTGLPLPELPWHPPAREAWKIDRDDYLAFFQPQRGVLIWFNRRENRAFFWINDRTAALAEESFSPLIYLWSWWFASQEAQLTHAAAIGGKNGAALLVGPSGSGKSTTSLLALNAPLRFIADDYCLVTLKPQPTVYSLFATAKVLLPDRPRLPWLAPAYRRENSHKVLYVVYPRFMDHISLEMPIRAVIAPKMTGLVPTRLIEIRPIHVMRVLAPSTLIQLSIGKDPAQTLRLLADLTRQVPCYHLLLGPDFEHIPSVLADLLDG